jgi:phage FluMu gp28-like protein
MRPDERQEALQLVDELQRERSGRRLADITGERVPHILLPYQQRWHLDESRVRFCAKGRRVGFTWGAWAAESALEAARARGGMDQFYMGYNQGMAAEFIGDCATFAKWYGTICSDVDVGLQEVVIANEKHDIVTYKIKFASGNKIEALSAMPHNWRGRQGHARIDEAGHHRDLNEVIDGALAYLMWGGRVSIGGTHKGEDNPFNELLKRIKAGSLDWSLHEVYFTDAVREGLFRRICLVTGQEWSETAESEFIHFTRSKYPSAAVADEELEGIPQRGAGAFFSRLLLEQCADASCQVLSFAQSPDFVTRVDRLAVTRAWFDLHVRPAIARMAPDRRSVFGQDFGRDGDLSVIAVGQAKEGGKAWRTPFRLELRRIPFDCQKLIVELLGAALPLFAHAKFDARGNGQSHAEAALQRWGASRVECVMLTPKWYDENWPRYHQAYEDKSIETFGDEDWIQDHRSVVLVNGQPRVSDARIKGSDGFDRHGDAAIAGLLCWSATWSDVPAPAGASIAAPPGGYAARRPGGVVAEAVRSIFGGRAGFRKRATAAHASPEGDDVSSQPPGSLRENS